MCILKVPYVDVCDGEGRKEGGGEGKEGVGGVGRGTAGGGHWMDDGDDDDYDDDAHQKTPNRAFTTVGCCTVWVGAARRGRLNASLF